MQAARLSTSASGAGAGGADGGAGAGPGSARAKPYSPAVGCSTRQVSGICVVEGRGSRAYQLSHTAVG